MNGLEILTIAPSCTVQDQGRIGYLRYGVTSGGAMDGYALAEGQTLLDNSANDAALELAEHGGRFRAHGAFWVATSGARMAIVLNGAPIGWRQSLRLADGDVLDIGASERGVYGYLHVAGGFQCETVLGSRATHLRAGFGHVPAAGQVLVVGDAGRDLSPRGLPEPAYFARRDIGLMWGPQSHYFAEVERTRFAAANFSVTRLRDRMGMQVKPDFGAIKTLDGQLIASDAINMGDIQVTGDGTPAILLADRGPTGGYPRIGTVISADIAALVQIPTGAAFGFRILDRSGAVEELAALRDAISGLKSHMKPMLRDPRDMADLLAYNLIDGVLRGDEDDRD